MLPGRQVGGTASGEGCPNTLSTSLRACLRPQLKRQSRLALAQHRELPVLHPDAVQALHRYNFPGNVRELENILERALALVPDRDIDAQDLQFEAPLPTHHAALPDKEMPDAMTDNTALPLCLPAHLQAVERALVNRALRQSRFHRGRAATLLGISLRQLRYRMQRLAIHDLD